jgi:spore protease
MIRTDLAMEATEATGKSEIPGIAVHKEDNGDGVSLTRVKVIDAQGSKAIGKSIGTYITVEVPALANSDRTTEEKASKVIAKEIRALAGDQAIRNGVLVIGLGNRMVTADSLGPAVCDMLFVTRHIRQYAPEEIDDRVNTVCAVAPGVLGVTGIETGEIIEGVVENIKPSLIIAVDSLASRNVSRIRTTVQISDSGISPGSGIGNKRKALNMETMGVPVIAIGVPLVVYASTIAEDLITAAYEKNGNSNGISDPDIKKMIEDISNTNGAEMVVTPKEIDFIVHASARVISNAINLALHENMTLTEIQKYMS